MTLSESYTNSVEYMTRYESYGRNDTAEGAVSVAKFHRSKRGGSPAESETNRHADLFFFFVFFLNNVGVTKLGRKDDRPVRRFLARVFSFEFRAFLVSFLSFFLLLSRRLRFGYVAPSSRAC